MSSPSHVHLPIAPSSQPNRGPGASEAAALLPPGLVGKGAPTQGDGPLGDAELDGLFQVGDLAKAAGRSVRAIHLYEELGLVRPHARSKGRYRLFDHDSVVRVRWIAKLQDLGLTLAQIQTIVREWEQAPNAPGAMKLMLDTYRAKLAETRAQISRLKTLEAELSASLHYLATCGACDPARLLDACVRCDMHPGDVREPELVAGFRAGQKGAGEEP